MRKGLCHICNTSNVVIHWIKGTIMCDACMEEMQ